MKRPRLLQSAGLALALFISAVILTYAPLDSSMLTKADITELKLGVEVTGNLQAVETSVIGPPQIQDVYRFKISMMAPEGEHVSEGEPVLGLDPTDLMQKLRTRSAEMESATKEIEKEEIDLLMQSQDDQLELAEAEARRRRAELKNATLSELISSIAEQQARLDLELSEIEVENINKRTQATQRAGQAKLAALKSDLDRAAGDVRQIQDAIASLTLTAPREGIVTYVTDWRNEKKKVGDSAHMRSNVIEIPNLSHMKAEGEVEEALAGRVEEGQRVTLHLDAHPDLEFTGRITSISRSVQKKSWRNPLKIVKVEISLDITDPEKMRPGMRFKGTIETDRLINVLTVPADAVFTTAAGPVAYRRTLMGFETVDLILGSRNSERVVVLDGLREGDRISKNRQDS